LRMIGHLFRQRNVNRMNIVLWRACFTPSEDAY
jgi:hypothetical protein